MANFKNKVYSSTLRSTTGKDSASHWHHHKQEQQQLNRIEQWLKNNPQAAKAYYKQN